MAAADSASKGTAIDSQGSIDPQGSIYLPLDPSKAEIRLLILHPGSIAVPITCHLTVVSLRQRDLDYEALSYCWGDPSDSETITLQDRPFPIRSNLFRALCRLRQAVKEPRTLWVDAVCINQTDIAEREQQVKLMGEIYSRTSNCIIWLGEFYEKLHRSQQVGYLRYTKVFPLEVVDSDQPVVFNGDLRDVDPLDDFAEYYLSFILGAIDRRKQQGEVRYWPYLGAFCMLRVIADNRHLYELPACTGLGQELVFTEIYEAMATLLGAAW
jgi:Heterokaryon incompatibility protein (HET)